MARLLYILAVLGIFATSVVSESKLVLKVLFKLMHISDVDVDTCVGDVSAADTQLTYFAEEVKSKQYQMAVGSLGRGISALSSAVTDCGVKEINLKLDAMAIAIKFAKVTSAVDSAVDIIVGAAHVEKDIEALAAACSAGDSDAIAQGINQLMSDWTQITGGCDSSSKGCAFVSGLLRVIQEIAQDVAPCEAALTQVVNKFELGAQQFKDGHYQEAVATFAQALDDLAMALKDQTCGLARVGDLVSKLSPKLAAAVVKIEDSGAVKIITGSADVYDDLFRAVRALLAGDYATFGTECGALLRVLRTSGCTTRACDVLEGVLASLQLELSSIDGCIASADAVWGDVEQSVALFDQRQPVAGVKALGATFVALANTLSACQVPELATIAETMLNKLGDNAAAAQIGDVVSILINGADMTLVIQQGVTDFKSKSYTAFGQDLATLASDIGSSKCHSVGCEIVQGLLQAAGVAFQDLEACEADIKAAEGGFVLGAQQFKLKQYKLGVQSFASSLNVVARAVGDCGLQQELGFIIQEANVLGLANVTQAWGNDMNILVHGADFYQLVYKTVQDAERHDWRSAGGDLHDVMAQLSQWTNKNVCNSDFCYVVVGIVEFLGDLQGSVKECEADFKSAWSDFSGAAANFSDSHHSIWHITHDKAAIKAGVQSLGEGLQLVAKGMGDCHVAEFADILARLAAKLGIAPEVSWFEEVLHILINGVKIENEVGAAMVDWGASNWPKFGFDLAALIKTLL